MTALLSRIAERFGLGSGDHDFIRASVTDRARGLSDDDLFALVAPGLVAKLDAAKGRRLDCSKCAACEATFGGTGKHEAPPWRCPTPCPDYEAP